MMLILTLKVLLCWIGNCKNSFLGDLSETEVVFYYEG